jgi:hypothetical protein
MFPLVALFGRDIDPFGQLAAQSGGLLMKGIRGAQYARLNAVCESNDFKEPVRT